MNKYVGRGRSGNREEGEGGRERGMEGGREGRRERWRDKAGRERGRRKAKGWESSREGRGEVEL